MEPQVYHIRPMRQSDLVEVAKLYATGGIWDDEPWNEHRKCLNCPTGKNNYGISFTGVTCPICGTPLVSYWDAREVLQDIRSQIAKPNAFGYVATVEDGSIIGFTWGYTVTIHLRIALDELGLSLTSQSPIISGYHAGGMWVKTVGYIDELGVNPSYRRHGIGKALTVKMLEDFSLVGTPPDGTCEHAMPSLVETVMLRTDDRAPAVKLYEEIGFQKDRTIKDPTYSHRGYWWINVLHFA